MKKLTIVALSVFVLTAFAKIVSAQSGTQVTISPATQSVINGNTFTVNVAVSNVNNLGGYQFTLNFDAGKVQVSTVTNSTFLGSTGRTATGVAPEINNTTGAITFGAFSYGSASGASTGGTAATLATITFNTIATGSSPLTLVDVQLPDATLNADLISTTVSNGTVTVTSINNPSPTPVATPRATPLATPTATPRPSASGNVTTIDDSITGTGTNQWNYSNGWSHCADCNETTPTTVTYYNASQSWSNVLDATASLVFSGTQVKLYAVKAGWHGIAGVSIDGGTETMVDLYAITKTGDVLVWTSPQLSATTHTLQIRVTGDKNANSSDIYVPFDRVDIVGNVSPSATPVASSSTNPSPSSTNEVAALRIGVVFQANYVPSDPGSLPHPARDAEIRVVSNSSTVSSSTVQLTANAQGIYSNSSYIQNIPTGTYSIFVKAPGHLTKRFDAVTLTAGNNTKDLTSQPLLPGNLLDTDVEVQNGEEKVNVYDYTIFLRDFGETVSDADFDFDGSVSIFDYAFFVDNFHKVGDR